MDLLRQEIQRKRKAVEMAKKSADVGRLENDDHKREKRTYLKAADVRKFQERQAEKDAEEKRLKKFRSTSKNTAGKMKVHGSGEDNNGGTSTSTSSAFSNNNNKESKKESDTKSKSKSKIKEDNKKEMCNSAADKGENNEESLPYHLSSSELSNALRELGIPIWLFGERDDIQRMQRLKEAKDSRRAAMAGLSEMDEYKLGSGHGIRNPFIGKAKDEDLNLKGDDKKDANNYGNNDKKGKQKDDVEEEEDTNDPHKTIHRFFKTLLRQWEDDLVNRPETVKRTAAGKNETKTLKQCKDYIRPLFKLCKNRTLEENIMGSILKIVNFCKEGEFVKANDAYMDVAIGRAAWPIGVTMVGIHQRTGRERINADKVAHVMNSELQRKYLTSVKRLITYCQKKRPDVDPSKKVTNV